VTGQQAGDGRVHAPARLDLREHLAVVRSVLANERTFLSYQRTALTQLALAASFIRFFDHPALTVVGWLLLPASAVTIGLGMLRYRRMRGLVRALEAAAKKSREG
jgi:putative membrane protein